MLSWNDVNKRGPFLTHTKAWIRKRHHFVCQRGSCRTHNTLHLHNSQTTYSWAVHGKCFQTTQDGSADHVGTISQAADSSAPEKKVTSIITTDRWMHRDERYQYVFFFYINIIRSSAKKGTQTVFLRNEWRGRQSCRRKSIYWQQWFVDCEKLSFYTLRDCFYCFLQ